MAAKKTDTSRLTRDVVAMPAFVRTALVKRKLVAAYEDRPAYQQNDYLGWITRAKREETKQKRLDQMLDELALGNVYMNMKWTPLRVRASSSTKKATAKKATVKN